VHAFVKAALGHALRLVTMVLGMSSAQFTSVVDQTHESQGRLAGGGLLWDRGGGRE
jgi:hypothetical protein